MIRIYFDGMIELDTSNYTDAQVKRISIGRIEDAIIRDLQESNPEAGDIEIDVRGVHYEC